MRLLMVEDEVAAARYIRRGLEREGLAVDLATDGEEGLWLAASQPYDVIILDIMLPRVDGITMCSRLREAGDWTPILMLTARDGADDESGALDAGADDYLTKPFAFAVLLARIRALARRGKAARPAVARQGNLSLDPARREVLVGEAPLALTATEFCMLEQLLREPGAVVSKQDFLGACWDWAFSGDPNIVEVYVRRLRSKLEAADATVVITTLRNAGYRLDDRG